MEPLGILSGTLSLKGMEKIKKLEMRSLENEFGRSIVYLGEGLAFIPRHGHDPHRYIPPHLINHQANMKALKDIGVKEVIAVNSTGSLKKMLKPGMLLVPDDYIMPAGGPTIYKDRAVHITPRLSGEVRRKLLEAAQDCGIDVQDGGIYWQTKGPRLETKAEIAMMTQFADVVGMTMASEAVIAQELDLEYASLCSVDNYAHGIDDSELTLERIVLHAERNTEAVEKIMKRYMERRGQ